MTFIVKRGTFVKTINGAPVSQTIDTGSGLEIKYLHIWTEQQVGTGFASEDQGHTEGWSNVTNEVSVGGASAHDANPTDTSRRMAELALSCIAPNGSVNFEGTITSFGTAGDAGKFTINWTTNNASADQIYFEAYCGDAILNVDIGVVQAAIVTGNQSFVGIGFQPNYLQYCSVGRKEALPATRVDNMVAIGSAISNTKRNTVAYYMNDDGADTISTQNDLLLRTLKVGGMGGSAEIQVDIDFVSFDADGWTHNMVEADNDEPLIGYCAVKFDPLIDIDIGVFAQPTSASTVNTATSNKNIQTVFFRSQNRVVIGTIINDGHARITTGIGVLPAPDEQVTGFDYDDSVTPTDSENMGVTDKAIKFFEQLSSLKAEANLIDSTVDSDFRLDWTTADAVARSILFSAYSFEAETKTLTHTTDSILKALDQTLTHTTDSLLKTAQAETHTTDSILLAIQTLTHTTDSELVQRQNIPHTTDSILKATKIQQHTTDSVLLAIQTLTHTTDSFLKAIIELTHTTDSLLVDQVKDVFHTTDTNIIDPRQCHLLTEAGGYLLQEDEGRLLLEKCTRTLTHTTDSILKELDNELTHTTDSFLIEVKIHTTDSILKALDQTVTHTTDSVLGEREPGFTVTHTTDSILLAIQTLTHTTDSVLKAIQTLAHTTDSVLLAIQTLAHTTDSFLKALQTVTHTTDSLLRASKILTHTTDSILKALDQTLTHTTDSVLGEREPGFTVTHTTDSILLAIQTLTHTTDSTLKALDQTLTHTTDSVLSEKPQGDITHTTDSLLRERFQADPEVFVVFDDTREISVLG